MPTSSDPLGSQRSTIEQARPTYKPNFKILSFDDEYSKLTPPNDYYHPENELRSNGKQYADTLRSEQLSSIDCKYHEFQQSTLSSEQFSSIDDEYPDFRSPTDTAPETVMLGVFDLSQMLSGASVTLDHRDDAPTGADDELMRRLSKPPFHFERPKAGTLYDPKDDTFFEHELRL